jgi:hypothetical protein
LFLILFLILRQENDKDDQSFKESLDSISSLMQEMKLEIVKSVGSENPEKGRNLFWFVSFMDVLSAHLFLSSSSSLLLR